MDSVISSIRSYDVRPLYVTNTVVSIQGNQVILTFENENRATEVKMSIGRAAALLEELINRIPDELERL
jgi:hypothetical protein